ncbi:MAG: DUF6318 family protein [Nocardioidaceae bacterium]
MRRTLTAVLAGGLWLGALTACDKQADAGADEPSHSSRGAASSPVPTHTAPATSTPVQPAAPVMPALAKQKTPAGAKAFARYYIDLLNYSWAIGAGDPLRRESIDSCSVCRQLANTIDGYTERGGWLRGGVWKVESVFTLPGQPMAAPKLLVQVKVSPGSWKASAHGDVHQVHAGKVTNQFNLAWVSSNWGMSDVVPA